MKIGQPKKYKTARALERAVDGYFASISYDEPIFTRGEPVMRYDEKQGADVPVLDSYGHRVYKEQPVMTADGEQMTRTIWVETPSIDAMCLAIGIFPENWEEFEKQESFSGVTARARGRILAYMQERLDSGKGTNGAKFRLECMHGWRPREDTPMGEGVQVIIDV